MAEAILSNLIETLASEALQAAASIWGFRSELQRLEATTNAIKEVILDAVEKQAEERVQVWLKRLKAVLYTADDLFDEYATLASRKTITRGNKYSKEVRLFFSKYNQIYLAIKVSRKIKKIRSELDDIENDGRRFNFIRRELDNGPPVLRRIRDDDHSYIGEDEVIGREDDKEAIMSMLVDPTEVEEKVSVVCLVGMGGLGKTALAQLVYNDEKIFKTKQMYREHNKGVPFPFEHCWNVLKHQPKWSAECEKKKPKRVRSHEQSTPSTPSTTSTPDMINIKANSSRDMTCDTVDPMERPMGRKAEKEKRRRLNANASVPVVDLLVSMQEERKITSERKLKIFQSSIVIQAEMARTETEKTRIESLKEEEQIMTLDTSTLTPMLQEYYHHRQLEILESRRNKQSSSSSSSRIDSNASEFES